jgi:DNA-binding transcriptional regulator YiaG
MRAKEYNAIRESFGKTQLEMAPVLSVSARTAQNYAAKGVIGPAKRLIEALQAMPAKLRADFLNRKE